MQKTYIVKHKDINVRMASRSGGIFTAVSDIVLKEHGIIYGCAVMQNFQASHIRVNSEEERNRLRGSKYVQSNMGKCYKQAKDDLNAGYMLLFSGTGCQIAGLKSYLEKMEIVSDNLLTMDLVCHGVPSPSVWKSFIEWIEKKHNGKVSSVNFRDKRFGWMSHFETVIIKGRLYAVDYYRSIFYKHYSLRPCCFSCPYANTARISDITIADAWGVDYKHSYFNDDRGVSLVIVNTEKGAKYLEKAKMNLEIEEVDLNDFMQPNLREPSRMPTERMKFWQDFIRTGRTFGFIGHRYGDNTIKGNVKSFIKKILGKSHVTKIIKKAMRI